MKKLFQFTYRIILCLSLLLPLIADPLLAQAATKATTIAELRTELAGLEAQRDAAINSKKQTQGEINNKKNAIYAAYQEKTKIELEIEAAKQKIAETEVEISNLSAQIDSLLIYLQLSKGENEYLQYVSKAQTMTDLVMRIAAVEQITESSQNTLEQLKDLIVQNENLQVELAQKNVDLDAKIQIYASAVASLNNQLSELNELNEDINSQIKNQQALISYYKGICSSETQKLSECVKVISDTGWNRPLIKGVITSGFGYRVNPITGKASSFHNGVDIAGNAEGTAVYSAAAGMVAAITRKSSCGGNIIYIHHIINGVAYTTQYAHLLAVNVNVGDSVTAATKIGTVGGYSTMKAHGGYDGCTTGAHLHFGTSKGHYLGGGAAGYSSWSLFVSYSVAPGYFPAKGTRWYERA